MSSDRAILANVQFLRFIAAMGVLVVHAQQEAMSIGPFRPWQPLYWGIGVDVFFVISGFIMFHLAGGKFGRRGYAREFLTRRIVRVVPLYWLFTLVMIFAAMLFTGNIVHGDVDRTQIVYSFLFIPWVRADGMIRPVLALGWTLNYEMLFYVMFALALLCRRAVGLTALIAAFVIVSGLHFLLPSNQVMLRFWSDPIILLFVIGIGIGMLRDRGVRLPPAAAFALAAIGIAILVAAQAYGFGAYGGPRVAHTALPAALIAAAAILPRYEPSAGRWRSLSLVSGNISYALYLSHPFSINALAVVWHRLHLAAPSGFFIAACLISIVGAFLVYHVVERPLLRWLSPRPGPPETYRAAPE